MAKGSIGSEYVFSGVPEYKFRNFILACQLETLQQPVHILGVANKLLYGSQLYNKQINTFKNQKFYPYTNFSVDIRLTAMILTAARW